MSVEAEEKKAESGNPNVDSLRNKLLKVLEDGHVSDLTLSPKVVVLDSKTDPKKAIEVLLQNKVRAAPVIDNATSKFIGVLDLRDTVKFALETYKKQSTTLSELKQKAMEYLTSSPQITTQSLKYLSTMRKFRTVKNTDTLLSVAQVLAKGSHIVGVIDEAKNTLSGIITQGQLFQQVAKKWTNDCWDESVTLNDIKQRGYVTSSVKSIKSSTKAYDAFELMSKLDLSGLAVVDNDGKLIHNTSATDIKLWLVASSTLEDSIEQFLINIRKLSLSEKYPITFCTLNDTFKRSVQKLQATRYHRLWIVDEDTKPQGVMALTDIFKFLCKSKEQ
mmetsp:Transcript_11062/g.16738  ORF Transcript_11062/g.16738 Transcript_11062/m.16738 type:complete len:332 (-) Transcript_11062:998-1993(-)|eukprot:CAMPEP_0202685772 /NCGR_PEP_ID=MMETSP1385-20130828/1609_1 /ASSEMBLY_ACC=CAM_ASM_000861 /TAXON_ID=933848 /ORGANISM="Elphidium margaritaceum" /LENGTH=331 /DNA_ID=CAMNT_0049340207 /DNA_START=69 /DNA_END=1064 /DNA_ORIENTATION=+